MAACSVVPGRGPYQAAPRPLLPRALKMRAIPIAGLLALALLACPAPTQARPLNADEMRSVELAHDYWGRGPACDKITYEVLPRERLDIPGVDGLAGECRIQLADDLARFAGFHYLCATVAHEWGHLLGHHHDTIPGYFPPCHREANRRVYRAARATYWKRRARCAKRRGAARRSCVRAARREFRLSRY